LTFWTQINQSQTGCLKVILFTEFDFDLTHRKTYFHKYKYSVM